MTISSAALAWSSIALAGEEPLYEPAPDWIDLVDLGEVERDAANSMLVNDTQLRIIEGQLWEYRDYVYKIASLADLSSVGTLKATWLPDKGDLIVHEVSILRDGEVIDVIAQGEEMEVLRRERMLEQRILDGSLTATMAVPGLQVGDELRLRYSVTLRDQALGDEVQSQYYLWREEKGGGYGSDSEADFARVRASWPDDLGVRYQAGPNYDLPAVENADGFNRIEVMMPLPEADDVPGDAPLRYRQATMLQLGTFDSWSEVSSVMAPYYETDGALEGLDDLIARIEEIRTSHSGELERAVAALELVQEDVRYLLNGLDGGNYLPQSVSETWDKKYGDCKAKTVILLAILDELGVEAEAVLVSSSGGNLVPVSLPLPGAFDHVLVRAKIDGNLYYLDGTSLGANLTTVGNVPNFEYALPIRASGGDIEPIKQLLPRAPDAITEVNVDATAGIDLPMLVSMTAKLFGPSAAQFNAAAEKLTEDRKRQMARGMNNSLAMIDFDIIPGDDDSVSTMVITGIATPEFRFEGLRGELGLGMFAGSMGFSPNRSRREWRDIPVSNRSGASTQFTVNMTLPDGAKGFELRDAEPVDVEIAGRHYTRMISLDGGTISVSETLTANGGETPPEAFREERRKAAALARQKPKLIAPTDLPRVWRFATQTDRSTLAPIEDALEQLIIKDPEEVTPYLTRAAFRYNTYDFSGSLEDMDKVVELEPTAEYFGQRSTVHTMLGNHDASLADLEEAYLLDPRPARAISLASMLAVQGKFAEARDILEYEDGDENVREELAVSLAELDALEGQREAGLMRITNLLADKPNDSYLLNEQCWFMGVWQVNVGDGISVCKKAVENSDNTSNAIDSRAMIFLRNGMLDEAKTDIAAALDLNPNQTASILLRGLIRLEEGDKGGQEDIDNALARDPSLRPTYRQWGFEI
ncbi:hypothetical protein AUC45_03600 [Erythrobacter sp. YT30]|nr:hypothetical protein AUC45_03600 [Erythrobacter sp. YT30]